MKRRSSYIVQDSINSRGCRLLLLTSLIGVVLFTVVNSQTTSTSPLEMASTDQEAQLLKGNSLFTTALYQELAKSGENLIFSPISVHAVLSMAFQGAEGETKDAFISTLRVTDTKTAADGYNSIMSRLNNIPNITLHIANKVYLKDGFSLKNSFKDAVVKSFLSEVEPIDFAQPAAAPTINTWVSNKTNDKIKELISANDLDSETRLVLLNAIYFKGNWAYKFDARNTLEEDFYINNDETVKVNMMHIKKRFNYKEDADLDAKILEMPYENRDVSMVIILPNERTGLANLEKKLANVDLSSITNGSSNVEVQVSLPRFKIESTIDLKETLTNMGLGNMFTEKCNLSNMIDNDEPLKVSKVIQKAFIEVNEEGAEAAAATGLVGKTRCLNIPDEFIANNPFIVALMVGDSHDRKVTLFNGHILNPNLIL